MRKNPGIINNAGDYSSLFDQIHTNLQCLFIFFFSAFRYAVQNSFDQRFFTDDAGQLHQSSQRDDVGKKRFAKHFFGAVVIGSS